ncbi:GNAT family N-acetyltransferase [Actinacidiphila yeochonensis]|uniref:GNAT family N-acetyltransferase n=1 Tax=Actinacidiphila yeochonensis TaxID=89050 RepID=UPI0018E29808|nr:GNAT family N-acetyltransferase [Actinacidiphila yeochonensis]
MALTEMGPEHPLLERVYDRLLAPAFPADELVSLDELRAGLAEGTSIAALAADGDRPLGVAVGEWSADSRVLLLAYLSVTAETRSQGIGGTLMSAVLGDWQRRLDPLVTLAEVEHPAAHAADPDRGDPAARVRFYARLGARALDLPYFQPALRPGAVRVPGMLLAVLAVEPALREAAAVPGAPVRAWLAEYFEETEGRMPEDAAGRALFDATDRPGGIPLLPLDDPAALPCARTV